MWGGSIKTGARHFWDRSMFVLVISNIHISFHKLLTLPLNMFPCGSVVEHCISSARGCGFDSQGTHILMKMYNLNAIVSRFG